MFQGPPRRAFPGRPFAAWRPAASPCLRRKSVRVRLNGSSRRNASASAGSTAKASGTLAPVPAAVSSRRHRRSTISASPAPTNARQTYSTASSGLPSDPSSGSRTLALHFVDCAQSCQAACASAGAPTRTPSVGMPCARRCWCRVSASRTAVHCSGAGVGAGRALIWVHRRSRAMPGEEK